MLQTCGNNNLQMVSLWHWIYHITGILHEEVGLGSPVPSANPSGFRHRRRWTLRRRGLLQPLTLLQGSREIGGFTS